LTPKKEERAAVASSLKETDIKHCPRGKARASLRGRGKLVDYTKKEPDRRQSKGPPVLTGRRKKEEIFKGGDAVARYFGG